MTRKSWIWPCRETSEISPRYRGLIAMHRMAEGGADVAASPDGRGFPSCETISCLIAKKSCGDSKLMTLRQKWKIQSSKTLTLFWSLCNLYNFLLSPLTTKQEGWGFVCLYEIIGAYRCKSFRNTMLYPEWSAILIRFYISMPSLMFKPAC